MKSSIVFRRIILTSQVISPIIGSSAFALGMRSRGPLPAAVHTASSSSLAAASMPSEEDFEFDFIAAATQAAVEREAREAPVTKPVVAATPAFRAPEVVAPVTHSAPSEEDYEFDFLAAATQAAIEREAREAHEAAEAAFREVAASVREELATPTTRSQPLMR